MLQAKNVGHVIQSSLRRYLYQHVEMIAKFLGEERKKKKHLIYLEHILLNLRFTKRPRSSLNLLIFFFQNSVYMASVHGL